MFCFLWWPGVDNGGGEGGNSTSELKFSFQDKTRKLWSRPGPELEAEPPSAFLRGTYAGYSFKLLEVQIPHF